MDTRRPLHQPWARVLYGLLVVLPGCIVAIPSSMVGILTLGYYSPCWDVSLMFRLGMWFSTHFRRIP